MQGGRGSNPLSSTLHQRRSNSPHHPLRRLTARRFAYPVTALRYPDAGHLAGSLTVYLHSVTDDALTTSGGTQAAQADAHVRLIGRVSSAWWWPGMNLLTNGP